MKPRQARAEPAYTIVRKLGGDATVAAICGVATTTVWRWTAPMDERGGNAGTIPPKHHVRLLTYARRHGIDLAPVDFLPAFQSERISA